LASISKENYNHEEHLFNTLDSLDIAFVRISDEGIILTINRTFNKIFGYDPEKNLIGTKALDYWQNSEERNKFREILYKNGIVKKFIAPVKKVDGEKIFLQMNIKLNKNSNGKVISSEGTFIDVTERIEIEQKLKESEEKFRSLYNNAEVGLFQTRVSDGKMLASNQKCAEMGGYGDVDQFLKDYVVSEHYVDPTVRTTMINKIKKEGVVKNYEAEITDRHGIHHWRSYSAIFYPEKGLIEGVLIDISERKEAEQKLKESENKLRQQNIELKKLDKTKNDFIINVSHELKTPMISISGYIDYILMKYRKQLKLEILEDLEIVQRNINRLEVLMNQFLEVLIIDEKKLTLNKGMENVSKIINNCIDELSYLINAKNLEIILNFDPKIILDVDPERIFTVFTNLISNAIKFTPEYGWIEISTKMTENQYIFEIKDNGIGLSQNDIKRLFKKFERIKSPILSSDIKFKDSGTGLGLYIVKGIIKAHEGEIRAYSKGENQGSTFVFDIPI